MVETVSPPEVATPYPFTHLNEVRRSDLVHNALQDDRAELTSWHVRELYGFGHGAQTFHVFGTADARNTSTPWSFVVKSFSPGGDDLRAASTETSAWDFWKREWLAYQAPWLRRLQGPVVAPAVLGVGGGDLSAWVALEDLSAYDRRPWTLAQFADTARHLGAFQAPYLRDEPLPSEPWLCTNRLQGWTEQSGAIVDLLTGVEQDPLARQILPPHLVTALLELWQERVVVYDALAALPTTLCHGDFYPRNIFLRPTEVGNQSVAIDWASCGRGAIGEDLSQLVDISLVWFEADPAVAAELESRCLAGYLEGLRAGGWDGDPHEVLLGYLAADVLSTALGGLTPTLLTTKDPAAHAGIERAFGRPMSVWISNLRAIWARQEVQLTRLWQLLGRT